MLSSTSLALFVCMECPRPKHLTEDLSLLPAFGNNYRNPWGLSSSIVLLIIRRLVDKLKESTKSWKTCCEPVWFLLPRHGMNVYPWQSSHTTTVIRKACEWHHLKLCMDEGADHRSIGLNQESESLLDLI